MTDYTKFMKENMDKALAQLPPKERADMNRLVQSIGKTMGESITSGVDLSGDIHKAHADFTDRLNSTVKQHDKMQEKYGDNSN